MKYFVFLLLAIVFEVAGTTCMILSQGFTRPWPSTLLFVFYAAAIAALTLALRRLDISIAYAIWSALGTTLIALIGVVYFREPNSWLKMASLGLIIAGIVGLNLSGRPAAAAAQPPVHTHEP